MFFWTEGLHHDGSALYVSDPTPALGATVTITLRTPIGAPITKVFLRSVPDGENHYSAMQISHSDSLSDFWTAELKIHMPLNPYRFKIITSEGSYYLNAKGVRRSDPTDAFDFKIIADYQAPAWVLNSVFYQIFPDRFHNGDPSNDVPEGAWSVDGISSSRRAWGAPLDKWEVARNIDFYGGDLQGIQQKLPYLADLGVNALYLNPIFVSHTHHRYDIADFMHVDPSLGGDQALADLRAALDAQQMRIMLDVTLNHCSWRHPWFTAAQQDPHADTADYFTFYERPHNYESWLGISTLIKLRYTSQRLREVMLSAPDSVLRHWLRAPYRIDGWRLDVQNTQARQGAIQLGNKVGRTLRRAVKGDNAEAYIIGENFYDASAHLQGNELDAVMNYNGFTIPLWRWLNGHDQGMMWESKAADPIPFSAEQLNEQWTEYRASLPWVIARQQFNLLGSHDTARILTHMDDNVALAKLGALILLTYVGTPSVYYGDEIGLTGGHDPYCRGCMSWDTSTWNHDLRAHYQTLIRLRRTADALIHGGYQMVYAKEEILVYLRASAKQRLLVVANRGRNGMSTTVAIPVRSAGLADGTVLRDLLTGSEYAIQNGVLGLYSLERGAGLILEVQS
jgi:alpha-glucosidase